MLRHAFYGLTVMFSDAAVAQTAPPAPAPPYGSNITLAQAKAVLAAAEAQAAKQNGTGAVATNGFQQSAARLARPLGE